MREFRCFYSHVDSSEKYVTAHRVAVDFEESCCAHESTFTHGEFGIVPFETHAWSCIANCLSGREEMRRIINGKQIKKEKKNACDCLGRGQTTGIK